MSGSSLGLTPTPPAQRQTRSRSTSVLPTSTSSTPKHGMMPKQTRRNSLRIPIQPPDVPIPPSLLHSPYLHAPKFHGEEAPHLPSEEDEIWLQDTVPLGSSSSADSANCRSPSARNLNPLPITPPARANTVAGPRGGDPQVDHQAQINHLIGSPPSRGSGLPISTSHPDARNYYYNHNQGTGAPYISGPLPQSGSQNWRRTSAGYTTRPVPISPGSSRFDLPQSRSMFAAMPTTPSHYFDVPSIR
ncbi:hypothetical protein CC1G_03828 [Coprinopsis cinerea okayama7|uniref:Uncharacterized protein n=1 Tax=Coprinopsis cinerea (strain Okayama-7 / 130 / ATCC MYA-4618 / FGSC 9003) TaxID=240176 RepID=A8NGV6_COPC7|nr:hypothetical protein CC1G_03828 [Coprinopsis cinerea okayama7\|eukprot:XP_001833611.2 hypothetical protein CC1G_03828 [Coprinopsis cinerea okayama7\